MSAAAAPPRGRCPAPRRRRPRARRRRPRRLRRRPGGPAAGTARRSCGGRVLAPRARRRARRGRATPRSAPPPARRAARRRRRPPRGTAAGGGRRGGLGLAGPCARPRRARRRAGRARASTSRARRSDSSRTALWRSIWRSSSGTRWASSRACAPASRAPRRGGRARAGVGDLVEQGGDGGVEHAGLLQGRVPRAEQRLDGVGRRPVLVVLPVGGLGRLAGRRRPAADAVERPSGGRTSRAPRWRRACRGPPWRARARRARAPPGRRGARVLVVGLALLGDRRLGRTSGACCAACAAWPSVRGGVDRQCARPGRRRRPCGSGRGSRARRDPR